MTAPRRIVRGTTYLVTRRCLHRQFLLKPSPTTNAIYGYLLAVAARRYGMLVHAFCVLSNHVHLVVTDPDARLPAFHQFLDALVARAVNASLGRWETFWAPNSYSAVALTSPEDVIEKTAYVLANPAAAGLVRTGRLWPGLWSDPDRIGAGPTEVARPKHFFDPRGSMPETATIELHAPPGFETADEFRRKVSAELAVLERRAAQVHGERFLDAAAVLRQKPTRRPPGGEARRNLNPRVAARDKWKRMEALGRIVEFLKSYRAAWAAYFAGQEDVLFPAGTYGMRVLHGVRCAAA